MQWFYNLKIGTKLLLSFIVVSLIAAFIGYIGYGAMVKMKISERAIANENLPSIQQLLTMNVAQTIVDSAENAILIPELNEVDRQAQFTRIADAFIKADNAIKIYDPIPRGEDEDKVWQSLKPAWEQWQKDDAEFQRLAKDFYANKNNVSRQKMIEQTQIGDKSFAKAENMLNQIITINKRDAVSASNDSDNTFKATSLSLILVICIGIILAIGLGIFISQIISKPVRQMVDAAKKIANGDVNVNVESDTKDEIGQLMEAFGQMVSNIREQALTTEKIAAGDLTVEVRVKSDDDLLGLKLKEMVEKNNAVLSNINSAAEQVTAGAKQVSIASQTLSQGSTEQAGSLEEITSSITEVAAQTKQNAVNSNQANELAMAAKDSAIEGNQQMKGMLTAMAEINDSSANISKIIKVIDEIAFQTNILALNAAVEAARAGQHGMGFAVVAEEVRNLAARSANAAKETTEMIEGSIKKVESGTKIAQETAQALTKIMESVGSATTLVAEIATASNQQASAIAQINQGIEQVSQVVQSNTATAEESAAASEELSSQTVLLKGMVARFKIRQNEQTLTHASGLSPELLKALEEVVARQSAASSGSQHILPEIKMPAPKAKLKINLDDTDFGKY